MRSAEVSVSELARPLVLDALLATLYRHRNGAQQNNLAPDLATAGRNLRELEHNCLPCKASPIVVIIGHGELLVHKVLLLLLTVPIPEFDLPAELTEPPEGIPTVGEGGHSKDLRFPGRVIQAECGHLITGG